MCKRLQYFLNSAALIFGYPQFTFPGFFVKLLKYQAILLIGLLKQYFLHTSLSSWSLTKHVCVSTMVYIKSSLVHARFVCVSTMVYIKSSLVHARFVCVSTMVYIKSSLVHARFVCVSTMVYIKSSLVPARLARLHPTFWILLISHIHDFAYQHHEDGASWRWCISSASWRWCIIKHFVPTSEHIYQWCNIICRDTYSA